MLRNRLLPVARLVSPFIAVALMLPATVQAQEALSQPVPGQTPTSVETPAAPQSQSQTPGTQTQVTAGGPQTQQQQLPPMAGGPFPLSPGSINMQPQIQVLVQPQIQVSAQPKGDAAPNAKADANINTTATPTATSSNETAQRVVAQPYTPPVYPQVYPRVVPQAPRVITRVVPQPQQFKPYREIKPLPRRKGLMITGWIVFSVSYLLTASNAADLYDRCPGMNNPGKCKELARDMFIPVAGPFMAMEHTKYATDDYSLAVAGSLQGAGMLMGVIGTAMFVRDGRRNRIINEYGLRVAKNVNVRPNANPLGGGGLVLRGQF